MDNSIPIPSPWLSSCLSTPSIPYSDPGPKPTITPSTCNVFLTAGRLPPLVGRHSVRPPARVANHPPPKSYKGTCKSDPFNFVIHLAPLPLLPQGVNIKTCFINWAGHLSLLRDSTEGATRPPPPGGYGCVYRCHVRRNEVAAAARR